MPEATLGVWGTQWVCFSCDGAGVGPGSLRRRTDELTSLSGSEMDPTAHVGGAGWEGGEGRPMVGRPSPQTAVPTHPALSFHPDPWRWFLGKQAAPRQIVVFSPGLRGIKAIVPAPGGMPVSSVSAPSNVGSVPRPVMQPLQDACLGAPCPQPVALPDVQQGAGVENTLEMAFSFHQALHLGLESTDISISASFLLLPSLRASYVWG